MRRVVIDTCVLIKWFQLGTISKNADMDTVTPVFSVITEIEALGFWNISAAEKRFIQSILTIGTIIPLDEKVIQRTIILRQQYRIKTPDAIIAASAMELQSELWTANISDFENIEGLQLYNPFEVS